MAWIRERFDMNGATTGYQVMYRDPVTGSQRSSGMFKRKRDARSQERLIEIRVQQGSWIDPDLQATPYLDWAQQWFNTKAGCTPKTLEGYESLLNKWILPHFGRTRINDIRHIHVEEWIATMHEAGLSASRMLQARALLSSTLKAAVRNQMIPSNPAEGSSIPRKSRKPMRFLSPSEAHTLVNAMPEPHKTMILTLAYTGMRQGELTALRRRRVNLLRKEIVIAESATDVRGRKVFGEPKNRQARSIEIPAFLIEPMARQLQSANTHPNSLVFTSTSDTPMDWSNFRKRVWIPAVEQAGVSPLRMHDLRHTAASILIAQGCQPKFVQEHLGHSSITVTMDRYGHLYPEARTEVADAFDRAYSSVGGLSA
jgi:integrase